jgi:hypothetical protein
MPPGGIAVAGAVGVAALHHAFGDGPFEEILQVEELLARLAEARVGMGGEERTGGGHVSRFSPFSSYGIYTA